MITLEIYGHGQRIEEHDIDQFFNVSNITIRTPTGDNAYRIYTDRTEWITSEGGDVIRVHVVTE